MNLEETDYLSFREPVPNGKRTKKRSIFLQKNLNGFNDMHSTIWNQCIFIDIIT